MRVLSTISFSFIDNYLGYILLLEWGWYLYHWKFLPISSKLLYVLTHRSSYHALIKTFKIFSGDISHLPDIDNLCFFSNILWSAWLEVYQFYWAYSMKNLFVALIFSLSFMIFISLFTAFVFSLLLLNFNFLFFVIFRVDT